MPELKPFKGIRYSSPTDLKDLTCPPYDVISPEEQDRLYDRHPHNAVRLELARDEDGGEKYRNVAATFDGWLAEGVLQQDETDCLYVYRQDFEAPDGSRRRVAGVLGALELEPFGRDSGVLPHEQTMKGPKRDRLELMNALPVNVSPIYAIFRGTGGLSPFYDALENRPPEVRFADDGGVLHRLWVIKAPAEVEMLQAALRPGPLVIADGHHRYETALAYHDQHADEPGDHSTIMCFCVDADSEGLVVLPYHRAFFAAERRDIHKRLRKMFKARPIAVPYEEALRASDADHPMVFVTEEGDSLVELSDADVVSVVGERNKSWRALDVVALHEVVLPKLLPNEDPAMRFSKDQTEIRESIACHSGAGGVLLRAVSAADIVDVARSGERMPRKASYFWPKAVTGLVFHSLS